MVLPLEPIRKKRFYNLVKDLGGNQESGQALKRSTNDTWQCCLIKQLHVYNYAINKTEFSINSILLLQKLVSEKLSVRQIFLIYCFFREKTQINIQKDYNKTVIKK